MAYSVISIDNKLLTNENKYFTVSMNNIQTFSSGNPFKINTVVSCCDQATIHVVYLLKTKRDIWKNK